MGNRENIISFDFQGWPNYKMNIRDIIQKFGATLNKETNKWEIPESEGLDIFPLTMEDDGMGYGVNHKYIISVDNFDKVRCNIFIDKKMSDEEIKKYLEK